MGTHGVVTWDADSLFFVINGTARETEWVLTNEFLTMPEGYEWDHEAERWFIAEARTYTTGAQRDKRKGKGRFDLLSGHALWRLARRMEYGTEHYGDRNWEKGMPVSDYVDSAMRHLAKYMDGMRDEDHLAAAFWNMHCACHTEHAAICGLFEAEGLDDFNDRAWENIERMPAGDRKAAAKQALEAYLKSIEESHI